MSVDQNTTSENKAAFHATINSMKQNTRGMAHLLLILTIVIVGIGSIGYLSYQNYQPKQIAQPSSTPDKTTIEQTTPTPDPTLNWDTYNNTKWKYFVQYPPVLSYNEINRDKLYYQTVDNITFQGLKETDQGNAKFIIGIRTSLADNKGVSLKCVSNEECLEEWKKVWEKSGFITDNYGFTYKSKVINNKTIKGIEFTNSLHPNETQQMFVFKENSDTWSIEMTLRNVSDEEKESLENIFDQTLSTFKFIPEHCGPCPQFMPPIGGWCEDGDIIPSTVNECGCQGPPECKRSGT